MVRGTFCFDLFRNEEMMNCRVIESVFADCLEFVKAC